MKQDLVWMHHPKLGDAQSIEVDALSIPHYKRAGWKVVGEDGRKTAGKPRQSEETKS